jgi:hypothetical protein
LIQARIKCGWTRTNDVLNDVVIEFRSNGEMNLMHRVALVAVLALTVFASAITALADGPERVADGPPPSFTDSTCGFPLDVQVVANREVASTWIDASGAPIRTIVTGTLKVVMTNPATGKSVSLNISGPAMITYNSDGTATQVLTGRAVIVDTAAGQLSVNTGRAIEVLPSGAVLSLTGRSLNLCAALS